MTLLQGIAHNGVLSAEDIITEQLFRHFLKADSVNGIGESFTLLSLFCKEEDGLLKGGQNFFLRCENLRDPLAHSHFLAPASADDDGITGDIIFIHMEWTLMEAASAAVAFVRVNKYLAVNDFRQTDRTGGFNLAFLTALAQFCIRLRYTLTINTKVVQRWLDAVVRTSANGNLELVWKC